MNQNTNTDFEQVLSLINQLSDQDFEKVFALMQTEILHKQTSNSLKELLLEAPTWTDAEYDAYQSARDHINKSRLS
jgi:hypothetical protein